MSATAPVAAPRPGRRGRPRQRAPDDDTPVAPVDLRLVPAALCIWGGSLAVLWAGRTCGLVVAAIATAGALGVVVIPTLRTRIWGPGLLAALICLVAATAMTALRTAAAEHDPLFRAAVDRVRADVVLEVDTDPVALPGRPGSSEDRFLVRATLHDITLPSGALTGSLPLTVFADGAGWGSLIPGERVAVTGVLGVDTFTSWPTATVRTSAAPTPVAGAPWWQRAGAAVRADFTAVVSKVGGDAAGLLPGLVLGDRTLISPALTQDARITGLTHLLAVSGSHFVLLCGAVLLGLRRAGPRFAAVGGVLFAVALVIVVRPSPSVLRAAVMGGLTLSALLIGRNRSTVPALAAAVIVLLLVDPALAEDPGFALSVQATGAIVLVAPRWADALSRRGWPTGWANLVAVPAVAQLATMPVIAGLSGTVSIWAMPANLLAAAGVPVALLLGAVVALLAGWWVGAAGLVAAVAAPAAEWIALCAHQVAGWPFAVVPWPADPGGVVGLGLLALAVPAVLKLRRVRVALLALGLVTISVVLPVTVISGGWPPAGWSAVGCDVGQGDGFVIPTGVPGEAVVIDTGPEPSLIDRCLDRLDVERVPLLILTHLHADHVDGLTGVFDGRVVDAVGVGPGREPAVAWSTVLEQAAAVGIPVAQLRLGSRLTIGGLTVTVLGPDPGLVSRYLGPNDQSLVVKITIAGTRMLFAGDVEDAAQDALVRSGADLRADVLKLPHHGSAKLRAGFMSAVGARIVMIGVGAGNDFGHPSAVALQLADQAGATVVLRTDTDGDIAVTVDGGILAGVTRGAVGTTPRGVGSAESGLRDSGSRRAPPALAPTREPTGSRDPGPGGDGRRARRRPASRPPGGRGR